MSESLSAFQKLGTVEKLSEAMTQFGELLEMQEQFIDEVGDFETVKVKIEEAIEVIDGYAEFGTLDEVKQLHEDKVALEEETAKQEAEKRVKDLADKHGVETAKVEKLIEKGFTDEEIDEFMEDMKAQSGVSHLKKDEENDDTKDDKDSVLHESRGSRLMSDFSK